jgi:ABC-type multidrug transport system fused ATPase/permease subunit
MGDVRSVTASRRRHIALVSQTPTSSAGPVRENIRIGRLDASDAEVDAGRTRDAEISSPP